MSINQELIYMYDLKFKMADSNFSDGSFLNLKCVRARQTPVSQCDDSLLHAVVDQFRRVALRITTPEELKEGFLTFIRTSRNTGGGVVESGYQSITHSELENRNVLLQSLAEYLQRDIRLFNDPDVVPYNFSRTHVHSNTVLLYERDGENSNGNLSNRSILVQLIDGRYFQSLEPYLPVNQLIKINQFRRELSLNEATVQKLQQLATFGDQSNVIVVCLIGNYRGGKSTLLNELLQDETAFSTSDGVSAHTHGVWICIVEHGDKYVVYLDTEGTHDPRAQNLGCVRMLMWCLSVCSEFMYNYSSVVGEDIIRELFNLGRIQIQHIHSNNKPFLRVLLRNFNFELQGQSPTEYLKGILQTPGGDVTEEKSYLLQNFPLLKCYTFPAHPITFLRQLGLKREHLDRDRFAEHVSILAGDLERDRNIYKIDDSALSFREWMSNIQHLVTTINSQISTNDSDFIDLSQCVRSINTTVYAEALRRFLNAVTDKLSVNEFLAIEVDNWKYFTDNKVGNVERNQQQWQDQIKQTLKIYFDIRSRDCFARMYKCDSLQNYLADGNNLWNQDFNRTHFLGQYCMAIYRDNIDVEKKRLLDQALEALPEIETQGDINDATQAEDEFLRPEDAGQDGNDAEFELLLNEDDVEPQARRQQELRLQDNSAENANGVASIAEEEDTPEQRAFKRENLRNLFKYISIQNNFENVAFDELIHEFSVWSPFRRSSTQALYGIQTTLNTMQLTTNAVNVGASTTGAVVGTILLVSLFVPFLNVITTPLFAATCVISGASLINALSKFGISYKKSKEMTRILQEDHAQTAQFYQSLDRLVQESQGRTPPEHVGSQVPVEAIIRSMRIAGDAAEIGLEAATAAGVAIGRGVAVGVGAIGVVVDLGMVAFSIKDLLRGSKHKLSPFLANKIRKLNNDSQIINAICYYVALHNIQLLLR